MLSFCLFEGLFDPSPFDQLPFPQNIYGRLYGPAWAQEIESEKKGLNLPPESDLPKEIAQDFYNGLGKKFGYATPENMQHDLNNTIDDDSYGSHSHHIISPWIMSNEEKEDLIKNGSDIDKFNKEKPSFGNAAVPFEYKSNDGAGDPGSWGGI